jgi:hypothetical protein
MMTYRHCRICGSPHGKEPCPVKEYNAGLEARDRERITAEMLFPAQPGLILMLREVQAKWMAGLAV